MKLQDERHTLHRICISNDLAVEKVFNGISVMRWKKKRRSERRHPALEMDCQASKPRSVFNPFFSYDAPCYDSTGRETTFRFFVFLLFRPRQHTVDLRSMARGYFCRRRGIFKNAANRVPSFPRSFARCANILRHTALPGKTAAPFRAIFVAW